MLWVRSRTRQRRRPCDIVGGERPGQRRPRRSLVVMASCRGRRVLALDVPSSSYPCPPCVDRVPIGLVEGWGGAGAAWGVSHELPSARMAHMSLLRPTSQGGVRLHVRRPHPRDIVWWDGQKVVTYVRLRACHRRRHVVDGAESLKISRRRRLPVDKYYWGCGSEYTRARCRDCASLGVYGAINVVT